MLVERAIAIIGAVIAAPKRRPLAGIRALYRGYVRQAILIQISPQYRDAATAKKYIDMDKMIKELARDIEELVHKYKLLDETFVTRPRRAFLLTIPAIYQHWHACPIAMFTNDIKCVMLKVDAETVKMKRKAERFAINNVKEV